ncbi:MAG TPA: DUF1990 domain-containing protein [Pyrinomonadaceae bacterium]|nr:DUF1990 domain-containing protein [Pyrinomonadaceae bacterium]
MFLLSHPTTEEIATFLRGCEADSFSYAEVGASRDEPPPGYHIDHNRVLLGYESDTWERAQQAIRNWKMFEVDGIELCFPDAPIEEGRNVAPLAKHLGFYSLNACRIVYVIDEADRFGFAYGTLSQHAEKGEERFTVEFCQESREVWYEVVAFSRPASLLVKLGYPYSRYRQKQFSSGSKAAILRAVGNDT